MDRRGDNRRKDFLHVEQRHEEAVVDCREHKFDVVDNIGGVAIVVLDMDLVSGGGGAMENTMDVRKDWENTPRR